MGAMLANESMPVLRVQTVLYRHEPEQIWRLLHGVDAAASKAIDAGLVGRIEWALGDNTESPILAPADVSALDDASSSALSTVTYKHFSENFGSSGGHNRLAERCPGDLLLILNPDTYPSPTAIVELVKKLANPDVGLVEARQIPLEHPREYDLTTGETSWASGCCVLVRRELFDQIEGFDDEHFFLHCDDVDFSWRARKLGHKVIVAPQAAVFHDKRPTPDAAWPAPDYELYHSALGRLMLATRWDRPDIVDETIASIEAGQSEIQRAALAEFRSRVTSGRIPAPEPDSQSVAQFIDGEYAIHRF
ncbi:MAG TPA: glycosyltransferase [Solirubrobacteraceae bacterium]